MPTLNQQDYTHEEALTFFSFVSAPEKQVLRDFFNDYPDVDFTKLLLEYQRHQPMMLESMWQCVFLCGDKELIGRFMLHASFDPQVKDRDARTILHYAAMSGDREIFELVLIAQPWLSKSLEPSSANLTTAFDVAKVVLDFQEARNEQIKCELGISEREALKVLLNDVMKNIRSGELGKFVDTAHSELRDADYELCLDAMEKQGFDARLIASLAKYGFDANRLFDAWFDAYKARKYQFNQSVIQDAIHALCQLHQHGVDKQSIRDMLVFYKSHKDTPSETLYDLCAKEEKQTLLMMLATIYTESELPLIANDAHEIKTRSDQMLRLEQELEWKKTYDALFSQFGAAIRCRSEIVIPTKKLQQHLKTRCNKIGFSLSPDMEDDLIKLFSQRYDGFNSYNFNNLSWCFYHGQCHPMLGLLETLLDAGLSPHRLFDCLRGERGSLDDHPAIIIYGAIPGDRKDVISLCKRLIVRGLPISKLISHLSTDCSGKDALMQRLVTHCRFATINCNASLVDWLEFFNGLIGKDADKTLLRGMLTAKIDTRGTYYYDTIISYLKSYHWEAHEITVRSLDTGLLELSDFSIDGYFKDKILEGISKLKNARDKVNALQKAAGLNAEASWQATLFSMKTGFKQPDVTRGHLHDVCISLAKAYAELGAELTFNDIELLLNSPMMRHADLAGELLNCTNKHNKALKDVLYEKAKQYPFIVYLMLKCSLIPTSDFDQLQGLQQALVDVFAKINLRKDIKSTLRHALATEGESMHPLKQLMQRDTDALTRFQQLVQKRQRNSKVSEFGMYASKMTINQQQEAMTIHAPSLKPPLG